jgi:hypothetical protein
VLTAAQRQLLEEEDGFQESMRTHISLSAPPQAGSPASGQPALRW